MGEWPKQELRKIAKADDLHIAPFRDDGVTYGTPTWIWSVAVDDALYVRAYNGRNSRWYHAAMSQKAGRIIAAGMTRDVAFEPAAPTIRAARRKSAPVPNPTSRKRSAGASRSNASASLTAPRFRRSMLHPSNRPTKPCGHIGCGTLFIAHRCVSLSHPSGAGVSGTAFRGEYTYSFPFLALRGGGTARHSSECRICAGGFVAGRAKSSKLEISCYSESGITSSSSRSVSVTK